MAYTVRFPTTRTGPSTKQPAILFMRTTHVLIHILTGKRLLVLILHVHLLAG
jgi:hypothetical protein